MQDILYKLSSDTVASIALVLSLVLMQLLIARAFRQRETMPDQVRRRWVSSSRNALILIGLVGLIMIWAPQLRTFALSLTAVAVALVIATKEILLCLSGSMLRAFTRAYVVGDIVEIGTFRGEVLDYDLLVTRLREFENPEGSMIFSGAEVNLPHSMLFTSPVRVLPARENRPVHRIEMIFEAHTNVYSRREEIERVIKGSIETLPDAALVSVLFATTDIGKQRIVAEISARTDDLSIAENAVICSVGNLVHEMRTN
ncbi:MULTISPECIES: mechanosensitive ion channel family protein [unclassified Erythrobacter]|uniref:mechanosensitive ion channel family protein n=1 Tax=unclassified Erythrobacter TaxID=2633097 RepID=UPI000831C1EE|nr:MULTISPECIES: mechanosensitive ion channel domain-containing protein [unclassified Erythrobacter]MBO6766761.1 mechanosensitive ion channel [Erythrobacter sp.]